jgi:hypothetical protein
MAEEPNKHPHIDQAGPKLIDDPKDKDKGFHANALDLINKEGSKYLENTELLAFCEEQVGWQEVHKLAQDLQISASTLQTMENAMKIAYLLYPPAEGEDSTTYHSLRRHIETAMTTSILAWKGAQYLTEHGVLTLADPLESDEVITPDTLFSTPTRNKQALLDEDDLAVTFTTMVIHDVGQHYKVVDGKLVKQEDMTYTEHEKEGRNIADLLLDKDSGYVFQGKTLSETDISLSRIKHGLAITQISDYEFKLLQDSKQKHEALLEAAEEVTVPIAWKYLICDRLLIGLDIGTQMSSKGNLDPRLSFLHDGKSTMMALTEEYQKIGLAGQIDLRWFFEGFHNDFSPDTTNVGILINKGLEVAKNPQLSDKYMFDPSVMASNLEHRQSMYERVLTKIERDEAGFLQAHEGIEIKHADAGITVSCRGDKMTPLIAEVTQEEFPEVN